jgi:hypothetical protein
MSRSVEYHFFEGDQPMRPTGLKPKEYNGIPKKADVEITELPCDPADLAKGEKARGLKDLQPI